MGTGEVELKRESLDIGGNNESEKRVQDDRSDEVESWEARTEG